MDYKKKYEDAVKKLEKFFINNNDRILYKHDIESVFPELKESENERIRKAIFKALSKKDARDVLLTNGVQVSDALSWLEKQGEQVSNEPNWIHHKVNLSNCSKEYIKAYYDGWNNCNQQHSQIEAKHKPTWSEEDEKMFSGLNSIVEDWYNTMSEKEKEYYGDCGYIDWLKSIKERMKGE